MVFDAVEDYGQFVGDLGLKGYTIAVDRAYVEAKASQVPIMSNAVDKSVSTPFLMEHLGVEKILAPHSFGTYTRLTELNINRFISYQSTYKYNGIDIVKGTSTNTGSGLTIGRIGGVASQYAKICLWSFLLFPYTLSEFLLERQLKRYKLGTLYPDMIEFRPIVKSNSEYQVIDYYIDNLPAVVGKYYPIDSNLRIAVVTKGVVDEVSSLIINGVSFGTPNVVNNRFTFNGTLSSKSPQKIDITIDEYIRYEDIDLSAAYPFIPVLQGVSWGDKLKVGDTIMFSRWSNLLPDLYRRTGEMILNGKPIISNTPVTVEKVMKFEMSRTYLKDNEPNCILAPQILRIPNASYKILGYIPDLTGKGNHGVFNNFAFTEESGVNEDGSIHFDGVEDFITIPTLSHGAKQVLMKVNWSRFGTILYDQRASTSYPGAILCSSNYIAYNENNVGGSTYIDGVLNNNITGSQLNNITHNITVTNEEFSEQHSIAPFIGCSIVKNGFAQMALFTFMSFSEISSEDEIKELNDIVGIEGGYVESPDYYWDAYGKNNLAALDIDYQDLFQSGNANKMLIDKSKAGLAALELYHNGGNNSELINRRLTANNFAYNEESGYGGISSIYKFATEPVSGQWHYYSSNVSFEILNNGDSIRITEAKTTTAL